MASTPPPQGQPYPSGAGSSSGTNGLAVGAFVSSLLGLLCGVGLIVGLVLGYIAKSQIDRSGGVQGGRGLAVAAIVIGWIGVGLSVLWLIVIVAA